MIFWKRHCLHAIVHKSSRFNIQKKYKVYIEDNISHYLSLGILFIFALMLVEINLHVKL